MRIYNRYIMTVAILLLLTSVLLVAFGIDSLDIYGVSFVIEALIVTEIYRYSMPRARRALNIISIMLLCIFLLILGLEVIKFLTTS